MTAIRILLADDHRVVLEGLHRVLEPRFQIVGEVTDGRALVAAAEKLRPDIIIVDISMPLLNGIDAARQIRKTDRSAKIVFLSMHPDVVYAAEALCAGGSAYVFKSAAGVEILDAIREVLEGRTYLTPALNWELVQSQMAKNARANDTRFQLTARQREVLQLIAEGRSCKNIADILHVSRKTVEFHKYRIMESLDIHTTAELVQYAMKYRIVTSQ